MNYIFPTKEVFDKVLFSLSVSAMSDFLLFPRTFHYGACLLNRSLFTNMVTFTAVIILNVVFIATLDMKRVIMIGMYDTTCNSRNVELHELLKCKMSFM